MIEIKVDSRTPVEFLGKKAYVSFVSYERTDKGLFTIDVYIPDVVAEIKLKGTLQQIADALGDEVSVTFA